MNRRLLFSDFKRLIRHGADPSTYAKGLLQAWLEKAGFIGKETNIMTYLIRKYSLDPDTRDKNGRTALFYSLSDGIGFDRLRKLKASYDVADNDGNTPLIIWVINHNLYPLEQFPQQYYQRQNNEGKTALHYAVIRGMASQISILLDYGADWRIKDNSGHTALDYARELKRFDICELMENYTHSI